MDAATFAKELAKYKTIRKADHYEIKFKKDRNVSFLCYLLLHESFIYNGGLSCALFMSFNVLSSMLLFNIFLPNQYFLSSHNNFIS